MPLTITYASRLLTVSAADTSELLLAQTRSFWLFDWWWYSFFWKERPPSVLDGPVEARSCEDKPFLPLCCCQLDLPAQFQQLQLQAVPQIVVYAHLETRYCFTVSFHVNLFVDWRRFSAVFATMIFGIFLMAIFFTLPLRFSSVSGLSAFEDYPPFKGSWPKRHLIGDLDLGRAAAPMPTAR